MENPIRPFLEQQGFVMLDGGLATELENRGADLDHFLWSAKLLADAPGLIRSVHEDYLVAGADVIATATYQASLGGFARAGFDPPQGAALMRRSVDLAVQARESFWSTAKNRVNRTRPLIAASIGPYGASLHDGSEYHGRYGVSRDALLRFHQPRLDILAATQADLFAFETIPSRQEAEVLLDLLEDYPNKPAWLSFSCRDGVHVSHGEPFADCAALGERSRQIVAVGVNCTAPEHISALLESAVHLKLPLLAYPNSGESWDPEEHRWAGLQCHGFPVEEWYRLGARLLGGCCRTGPGEIRQMRRALEQLLARS
jgi:homocysteine S-methyltransferase